MLCSIMELHSLARISSFLVCAFGVLLNVLLATELPKETCGYKSCTPLKEGFINVHVISHTHLDLGWVNTLDEYFYGYGKKSNDVSIIVVPKGVKNLITDVLVTVKAKPERRFVFAETAFLWMWWQQSNDTLRNLMRELANNGQLEIVGGGWSMNDEAVTHYQSIIDQYTLGFRKLYEMLGECGIPKVGWQIDPFGHSREMASLFAEMDYDGLFLGRVDWHDKEFRFETRTAEFVWKGDSSNILTLILPNLYDPPENICLSCYPTLSGTSETFDETISTTIHQLSHQANNYATSNLILTMGGDFQYQYPMDTFESVELIIRHINNHRDNHRFNLIYSTPSCYLKAVRDEAKQKNLKFFLKSDDFFPYASKLNTYWTGFYTSRPSLKRLERLGNNYLQICKNLFVLANLSSKLLPKVETMSSEMGIFQHHDAITGTQRQIVADDYIARMSKAFRGCDEVTYEAMNKLVFKNSTNTTKKIEFENCMLRNISQCKRTEYLARFAVTVYNPLSRYVNYTVRFPVRWKNSQVLDPYGAVLPSDILPILDAVARHPARSSKTKKEVVFNALNVPPFGFMMYYVYRLDGDNVLNPKNVSDLKLNGIEVSIDRTTGKLTRVAMNGKDLNLTQDFCYYNGYGLDRRFYSQSSGAYVFRPYHNYTKITEKATFKIYEGQVIAEVHQYFNNFASQVIRINKAENLVEFDWIIGPLPTHDNGKEVITKYSTSLQTNSTFYTDSNGRQTMKRVRNYRRAFILASREAVAANYYPVTTKIVLRDENADVEVAVLTDRPQGGTSMDDGDIELMVHRVCLYDDALGVDEGLMETENGQNLVVRGSHYLVFGSIKDKSVDIIAQEHDIAQRKHLSAWAFVSSTNGMNYKEFRQNYKMEFSGLSTPLPKNVHILTLEPWKKSKLLLRIEHIYEADDYSDLSKPVTINVENLFSGFRVISATETTLGGNKLINRKDDKGKMVEIGDTMDKLVRTMTTDTRYWRLKFPDGNRTCSREKYVRGLKLTLCPLEIRSFIIEIKRVVF